MSIEAFPIVAYWHATKPVYSVTFESGSLTRFITCGGDSKVKIWAFKTDPASEDSVDAFSTQQLNKTFTQLAQESVQKIEFLSSLVGFEKTVNVGKFSHTSSDNCKNNVNVLACAGDDGTIMLWKKETSEDTKNGMKHSSMAMMTHDEFDDSSENKENWYIWKKLRSTNTSEIYDISWSPDNDYLVAGCLDYSVKIFHVQSERCLYHSTSEKGHSNYVQGVEWDPLNELVITLGADRAMCVYKLQWNNRTGILKDLKLINKIIKGDIAGKSSFLFKNVDTSFFRRLKFSPCGSILLAPAGIWKQTSTDSISTLPDQPNETVANCVHIFSRANLLQKSSKPIGTIPNLSSRAVAIAFSPVFYKIGSGGGSLFDFPYRLVFAVATLDQVLIYETDKLTCIAVVRNLHYSSIHDLAWNNDGSRILVSANDGFVSTVDLSKFVPQFGEILPNKSDFVKPFVPTSDKNAAELQPKPVSQPAVNVLIPRKK
ncbi:hypothetical protein ACO0QE_003783 [Hanseniaspora vineae]